MPTAVQIGAGKIGRGFLARLLRKGGYDTTFVDIDSSLVASLNARRSYPLRLVTETASQELSIDGFRGIAAHGPAAVPMLVESDLICTAVGVAGLPQVALLLARGVNARAAAGCGPVDILLCENQWHAAALMCRLIEPHIAPQAHSYFHDKVGLIETVVGIMVPVPTEAMLAEDSLLLVTEPFDELPIAESMLRGLVPAIPGLILTDNIEAYEARKLYLHNMSHAALAYLGSERGYEYIWQCAADTQIADICRQALRETAAAVSDRYEDFSDEVLENYCADLMTRFANKALGDTVARVAADPLRKLRPTDRLIGAAGLCSDRGTSVEALAKIIAAALRYDNPADAAAVELQRRRRNQGDKAILKSLCGVDPSASLFRTVRDALAQGSR